MALQTFRRTVIQIKAPDGTVHLIDCKLVANKLTDAQLVQAEKTVWFGAAERWDVGED